MVPTTIGLGFMIVTVAVDTHPDPSVTVTVYVPDGRFVAVCVV